MEATRLLAHHPGVSLRFATSDRWVGQTLSSRLTDIGGKTGALTYVSNEEGLTRSADCSIVLLATPAETSLKLAPALLERSVRVIDLSGAFRLRDLALYPLYYGFPHTAPALLQEAVYGLPELVRETVRAARLVANPGCYATCVALALAPLLKAGLLEAGALISDAASGVARAAKRARTTASRKWPTTFGPTRRCATSTRRRFNRRWGCPSRMERYGR
jgi:N-acetyl-gamma-glutamyl-phosphate reductase